MFDHLPDSPGHRDQWNQDVHEHLDSKGTPNAFSPRYRRYGFAVGRWVEGVAHRLFSPLVLTVALVGLAMMITQWTKADTTVTETFSSTTNIDTAEGVTTATVDTAHQQVRLTTTDGWTNTMGLDNGENVNGISFAPGSTTIGWAVTGNGNIYKTVDAGVLWADETSGTTLQLRDVFFVDTSTGYSVGGSSDDSSGIVLKTTNGGSSWSAVTPSGASGFYSLYFSSATTGWIVGSGGHIYHTTNSGSTWTAQDVSGVTVTLRGISLNSTTGVIVGSSGKILKSTDTGSSWSARTPAVGLETTLLSSAQLNGVYLASSSTGWIVANGGGIIKTSNADGSFTLTVQSIGLTGNAGLDALINASYPGVFRGIKNNFVRTQFSDTSNGMFVASKGTLMTTANGGSTLTLQFTGTNHDLHSLVLIPVGTSLVVGDTSIILKSTDSGVTWNTRTQGRFYPFNGIAFPSSSVGLMVGWEGTALRTIDSGSTWQGVTVVSSLTGANGDLNAVSFADSTTGWIVGSDGGIYKSTDAGITWSSQTSGASGIELRAIGTIDANTAYVVGDSGTMLATTDGSSWTALKNGSSNWTTNNLKSVSFPVSAATGWAVGAGGTILKTTNNGSTWTSQSNNSSLGAGGLTGYTLSNITMIDNSTGFIAGSSGLILKTTDGGSTWTQQTSGTTSNLYTILAIDANTVWIGGQFGVLVNTTNGGTIWSSQVVGNARDLLAMAKASSTNYWIVGQQLTIVKTTNSGTSFSTFATDNSPTLEGVSGSGSTVFAAGFAGVIAKSTDQGVTWTQQTSPTASDLNALTAVSATQAWAVGSGGTIVTTNDGALWSTQASPTAQVLESIDHDASGGAWAVGLGGTIIRKTSSTPWATQTSGTSQDLYGVSVADATTVYAVGSNGTIRKTVDAGATAWTAVSSPTTSDLLTVSFVNASTGWIGGVGGLIYKTADGGSTWTQQTSGTGDDIKELRMSDSQTVYAVGSTGTLLHTINGGTTWTSTASVHAQEALWVNNFETVVAVGGGSNRAAYYTPRYANGSTLTVHSKNINNSNEFATSATLTATSTLNGQTINYFVSPDGGINWIAVTSGTEKSLDGYAEDVRWRADLSSSSSSASPRLTQVVVLLKTTATKPGRVTGLGLGAGGGTGGGSGSSNIAPSPPSNPQVRFVAPSTVQWLFVNTSTQATEFRLYKKDGDSKTLISSTPVGSAKTETIDGTLYTVIEESGFPAGTNVSGRTIYAANLYGESTPDVSLPAITIPGIAAVSLEHDIRKGENEQSGISFDYLIIKPDPLASAAVEYAISEEATHHYLNVHGGLSVEPLWQTWSQWGGSNGVQLERFSSDMNNLALSWVVHTRLNAQEGPSSQPLEWTTAIETPQRIVLAQDAQGHNIGSAPTSLTLQLAPDTADGIFHRFREGLSGFYIERCGTDVCDDKPEQISGWIQEPAWTFRGLLPNHSYTFHAMARNQAKDLTPWSGTFTFQTASLDSSQPLPSPVVAGFAPEDLTRLQSIIHLPPGATLAELPHDQILALVAQQVLPLDDPGTLTFTGTGLEHARVVLAVDGVPISSGTTADEHGAWSLPLDLSRLKNLDPRQEHRMTVIQSIGDQHSLELEIGRFTVPEPSASASSGGAGPTPSQQTAPESSQEPSVSSQPQEEPAPASQPKSPEEPAPASSAPPTQPSAPATPQVVTPPPSQASEPQQPATNQPSQPAASVSSSSQPFGAQQSSSASVASSNTEPDQCTLTAINAVPIQEMIQQLVVTARPGEPIVLDGMSPFEGECIVELHSTPRRYRVKADSQGHWQVIIPPGDIEMGSHTITVEKVQGQTALSSSSQQSPQHVSVPQAQKIVFAIQPEEPLAQQITDVIADPSTIVRAAPKIIRTAARVAGTAAVKAAAATQKIVKAHEPTIRAVTTVVVPVVVAAEPSLWPLLPRLPMVLYHGFVWLMTILGLRRRRAPWGVVYDAISKEPIALAIVRLKESISGRVVETQVTDRQGRYGFLVRPGSYQLEVSKGGHTFPSRIVQSNDDGDYTNCYYTNAAFTLAEAESIVTRSVPLDPEDMRVKPSDESFQALIKQIRQALGRLRPYLMTLGVLSAVIVALSSPSVLNVTLLLLYAIVVVMEYASSPRALKSWGMVFDALTLKPVALATVDIVDTKYNKLLKSRLSDYEGRFAFLPPSGTYTLNVRKQGFLFPATLEHAPARIHPYHGEALVIDEKHPTIDVDLPIKEEPVIVAAPTPSTVTVSPSIQSNA